MLKEEILCDLTNVGLHVFEDMLIPGVGQSVKHFLDKNIRVAICTGDRYETSLEVVRALNISSDIKGNSNHIQTAEDLYKISGHDSFLPLFVNGRILNELMESAPHVFRQLLTNSQISCIYRTSPTGKQRFVAFLSGGELHGGNYGSLTPPSSSSASLVPAILSSSSSSSLLSSSSSSSSSSLSPGQTKRPLGGQGGFTPLMIGDGANDKGAIEKAPIGVACKGESENLKSASDIYIDNWNQLPALLEDCANGTLLTENICKWNMMQHMMKAYSNLAFFVLSVFTQLSEHENFIVMLLFKASLFFLSRCYCEGETLDSAIGKGKNSPPSLPCWPRAR